MRDFPVREGRATVGREPVGKKLPCSSSLKGSSVKYLECFGRKSKIEN